MAELSLREMVENLSDIEDIAWGMYAFSRDPLRDKVDDQTKRDMIQKAICCGYEKADEVMEQYGTSNPEALAEKLHLKVELLDKGQIADRILFALFTPPDKIEIMEEPIKKALLNQELVTLITEKEIKSLILGHEIFHYLENEDEGIYTRTEKIKLWKFFGFTNFSTIRALSEIAGMYFTKKLNKLCFSPFALDVILYYNYDMSESEKIYKEILSCK